MSRLGVDVSGNQTLAQISAAAADPANAFVICKATQGKAYISSAWPKSRELAGEKYIGAYHFAEPDQDPILEADHFIKEADLQPGHIAALDMENWDSAHPERMANTPWSKRVAYAVAWLEHVQQVTGAQPVIYLNWNWIKGLRTAATPAQWARLTKFQVWLADYSGVPGQHPTINGQTGTDEGGWPIILHQYGVLDGIGGRLDRNYTPDIDGLRKLAKP